jgi:FkbM family methyltransferase
LKNLFSIFKFIWYHPLASRNRALAIRNFLAWQIGQKINKYPMLYPLVEDSVLLVEKGMTGATGNIYTGLLEFDDMAFILHALNSDDLFADIGANIGVYAILASKNVGAKVVAVEPIPSTFNHLSNNVFLNKIAHLVTQLQIGVGNEEGVLAFTNTMDSINHVVINYNKLEQDGIVQVPVQTLDDLFKVDIPVIMKMDIEGYEWPALNGAKKMLGSDMLKAIIIELNGCGNAFGFSDIEINKLLLSFGFKPYSYNPFTRSFAALTHFGKYNTIYIKDIEWATQRVCLSKKYKILGQYI